MKLPTIGSFVTTVATVRPRKFAGKRGRVVRILRTKGGVEVGVSFVSGSDEATWFRPEELEGAA